MLHISTEQFCEHDAGSVRHRTTSRKGRNDRDHEARSLRLFCIADPAAWVDAARWVSAIACAGPRFEGGIHMPSKSNSDFYQIAETLNAHELAASAAILLSAISNNRPAKTIPWAGSARCQDRNRH